MTLVVNLCSGAGGWESGLAPLGIRPIGIELDADAAATARAAGHHVIRADIATYPPEAFRGAEGLIASPPCQAFSKAGKRQGLNDPRGQLVWQPVLWADAIRPRWIACEQVPEVLPIWKMEAARLRTLGYRTWTGILDAADYGVAQNRQRAILIASLDHQPTCPPPTHCAGGRAAHDSLFGPEPALAPWVSMAEALGWGWDDTPARTVCGDRHPRWMYEDRDGTHGRVLDTHLDQQPNGSTQQVPFDRPAPAVTAKSGGQWKLTTGSNTTDGSGRRPYEREIDRPAPTIDTKAGRDNWTLRYPGRSYTSDPLSRPVDQPAPCVALGHNQTSWCWERPATTIVGSFGGGSRVAPPGHHTTGTYTEGKGAVKVTLAELARLQDFPDGYPFVGTRTSVARQIGNAIPAGLAQAVGAEATRGLREQRSAA